MRETERERVTDRQRETERETERDRQTDRQTDRDRQRDNRHDEYEIVSMEVTRAKEMRNVSHSLLREHPDGLRFNLGAAMQQ